MARWEQYIRADNVAPGVITVTIQRCAYPMVAEHWRQQLTGRNKRKWGKIYIDPDPGAKRVRRSMALAPFEGLYKGEIGNNNDECPGAMFIWRPKKHPMSNPRTPCQTSNSAVTCIGRWNA
jgi:hypothetical protein